MSVIFLPMMKSDVSKRKRFEQAALYQARFRIKMLNCKCKR